MRNFLKIFLAVTVVTFYIRECTALNSDGSIPRNLSIENCITGGRPKNVEEYITTTDFARKIGYEAEEHAVVTDDGHILTIHRIPGKAKNATPVFLQHGILACSYQWVAAGKEKALAFILSDGGYDVWMGNVRGTTYSRCHTRYSTLDFRFWDHSWHEMAIYDLPATINYVTNATDQNVIYIGYSMGTTMFYVMASQRPDIASKVKVMFSLAPVAYSHNIRSPLRLLTFFEQPIHQLYLKLIGRYEFVSQNRIVKHLLRIACTEQQRFCANLIFFFVGSNPRQFNNTLLKNILTNSPAGVSFKCILHFSQVVVAKHFQHYDYGAEENLKRYKNAKPPNYDLSKIQVPMGIFWSNNDYLSNPIDVQRLFNELPNVILNHKVKDPLWNHIDYVYGIEAYKYVYSKLLFVMKNYR